MISIVNWLSIAAIPGLILLILLIGAFRNVPVFDVFLKGAADGFKTSIKILPVLVGIMLGINIFKASGAMDLLVSLLKPAAELFAIPGEILPMAILRPISGSASIGLLSQQLEEYGPDGFIGKILSVMMGSSETIFYTMAVYFGAIRVKKTGNTLWIALIAGAAGVASSVIVCRLLP